MRTLIVQLWREWFFEWEQWNAIVRNHAGTIAS
jgi:hypothetical protein